MTNLQALETVLRYFLLKLRGQKAEFPEAGDKLAKKTYLTRSLSLDKLIRNYNSNLSKTESKFAVNKEVVTIRNAFAHGRLLTVGELPGRLWNFSGSEHGHVAVEFSEELTVEWMKKTAAMIEAEKNKVLDCFKTRGYQGLR